MKNSRFTYLTLIVIFTRCDYTTIGEICNRRNEDIELVISPFHNAQYSILNNDRLVLTKWDTVDLKGYFRLASNTCAPVAEGINSFLPEELIFNYIEVRTTNDTIVIGNQKDIHRQFKETKRHFYQWTIE
jgi:hypothetical protein